MHTAADRRLAVSHWLQSAHPSPEDVRREWSEPDGVALLPLGTLLSAVRIPYDLVDAIAACGHRQCANEVLDHTLDGGPVICDPRSRRYYALVPASAPRRLAPAAAVLARAGVECLSRGTYLGVPRVDALEMTTWQSYWAVPMPSPGELCEPQRVADLIAHGMRRLAAAEADA
ncbi:hypothetical protein ACFOOM_07500 [Streptomyces echinoruber]|uniref:Uncharacterized protein n=1 Tax=Streptomyces echinoruber TaxID=68898 RepID=A0A918QYX6_9ACTN|nr:hypothetical protein [Streptomyces echinoruber]GGZ80185.1 hypothetical protein GCM10010389_17380 [Streptomyces echinoruber]